MAKFHFRFRYLIGLWLLLPMVGIALHFQYGVKVQLQQKVENALDESAQYFADGEYEKALQSLDDAQKIVNEFPEFNHTGIALRKGLVLCKTGELEAASEILNSLLVSGAGVETRQEEELREALATALYYDAWYMRVQGYEAPYWEPVADHARRQFKYLVENTADSMAHQRNLEAAIRLTRMDLATLKDKKEPEEVGKQKQKNDKDGGDQKDKDGKDKKDKGKRKRPGPGGDKPKPGKGKLNGQPKDIREKEGPEQKGGYGAPDLSGS